MGIDYHINHMTFKAHGCCGHTFPSIDGVLHLVEQHKLQPQDIKKITLATYKAGLDIIDNAAVDQNDDHFYNNLFVGPKGLSAYDEYKFQIKAAGNVYLKGGQPSAGDTDAVVAKEFNPNIKLTNQDGQWWLEMKVDPAWMTAPKRPACATIWASCSWKRALSTECVTPSLSRYWLSSSDFSIETVPTSTGWPISLFSRISLAMAWNLSVVFL